jgi:hypothetical protein
MAEAANKVETKMETEVETTTDNETTAGTRMESSVNIAKSLILTKD